MYGGKQCDRIQKINQKHSNNQNRTASYVCLSNNPSHPGFQLLIVNLSSVCLSRRILLQTLIVKVHLPERRTGSDFQSHTYHL